ncbi:hypothetical protein J5J86_07805 [Aquabacter sp. L1I39]|uniref:methyltransferase domain-containing protein n=1 Tax=Aquabacter sp. L1I39 TaxID=2820278 RepID=UPI001ADA68B8|nr:methyltransferase domain-containing protein [Aquabacter sp. L1I39]QTL05184.1 hypothetical protein J5J86_07805 [Aquabacter sp. L1I39]
MPDPHTPAFDAQIYRQENADLQAFADAALLRHYLDHGRTEGRIASRVRQRADFLALIPAEQDVLEIGPFLNPCLRKEDRKVLYFDVLDRDHLVERARALVAAGAFAREQGEALIARAPVIDFVHPEGDLGIIDRTFAHVLSSHCAEHQPDLVAHLQSVSRLLEPGGCYFLVLPDHRYCFDHFLAPTRLADVLAAHVEGRRLHSALEVLEHRLLTTHSDPTRHWSGDHGTPLMEASAPEQILHVLEEARAAQTTYVDVHSWKFTPDGFRALAIQLEQLGLVDLTVAEVYPTLRNTLEFFAVLRKA